MAVNTTFQMFLTDGPWAWCNTKCMFVLLQSRGIDATIFQNPAKLHLTIGTLALVNDNEIQQATDLLELCHESIIQ